DLCNQKSRRDVRLQSRLFARWNQSLRHNPNSNNVWCSCCTTGGKTELIKPAGLLQCDFAHELDAHDLANIEAFHCDRLLLIGCAHDFSRDRVELFAPVI